jgi:uncharacterized protein
MAWGRDMALSHRACIAALLMSLLASQAAALDLDSLYSSKAIVTGKGEKNRQPGLRDCLDRVLVKVSGDQRLPGLSEAEKLRRRAGDFVASFSYRDRLAGKPIHDEQGTYDRPHDLTCRYDRKVIDDLLGKLGSRPWLGERPVILVTLDVERNGTAFRLTADEPRGVDMRESFANAARPLELKIAFPGGAVPQGAVPLGGTLRWSDADLGWVATWRLPYKGRPQQWVIRGVNFDEAFRVAMRGAIQILSGNGTPK